jgi:hypothetical protein
MHPALRAALKEAHPGLTDAEIDRSEELLVQRMLADPEKDQETIARIDRERLELIERVMPRYAEVAQVVKGRLGGARQAPTPGVRVEPKKSPDGR